MMQGIMESIFDVLYLGTDIVVGYLMIKNAKSNKQYFLFGIMSLILGFGDAFHLIPRAYGLLFTGLENNAAALGIGKLITSITMTIFYILMYHIWRERYGIKDKKNLTYTVYFLAIIRVILCLFKQNDWLNYYQPVSWGIYRNIPFAILGAIIIVIYYLESRKNNDTGFKNMHLAVILSFGFYIPVVLFSNVWPLVGILMIPKTMAYVWVILMGYFDMKKNNQG